MIPPHVLDAFASPIAVQVTPLGVYSAVRLPTLDETRRARRTPCTCTDGTCRACFFADDHDFNRSQDI